ncbi:MAG TPA: MG2 domain-containing protein [Acidobacteriota bacterium]|nr:MG2 domain-containing protein [Acidobacteriota bacterium]
MKRLVPLLGMLFCTAGFAWWKTPAPLQVDVDSLRVDVGELSEGLVIQAELRGPAPQGDPLRFQAWLLESNGATLFHGSTAAEPGRPIRMRADAARSLLELEKLHTYRLRYQLTDPVSGQALDEDYLSLHHLVPAYFQLRSHYLPEAAGEGCRLQVSAYHPFLKHPVAGVDLTLRLTSPGPAKTMTSRTGPGGVAVLQVSMPEGGTRGFELTGSYRGFERRVKGHLYHAGGSAFLGLVLEKQLFRPGQTVRASLHLLDPSGKDVAGRTVRLTATNPGGAEIHRSESQTSAWGIAAAQFQLPPEAPAGFYWVKVECTDKTLSCPPGDYRFQVQSHQAPSFLVDIETDRPFYQPGQTPVVSVQAVSPSGRPLRSGLVRIESLSWVTRSDLPRMAVEADLKPDGTAQVALDLSGLEVGTYRDVELAATVSGARGGGRAEKRFKIRIARYPIQPRLLSNAPRDGAIYFSTHTAVGKPVACKVLIRDLRSGETVEARTNRHGYGKSPSPAAPDSVSQVSLKAECGQGMIGVEDEADIYPSGEACEVTACVEEEGSVRLRVPRSLFRPGQDLAASIEAEPAAVPLVIDVIAEDRVLSSHEVERPLGRAEVRIPYRPELAGIVAMNAFDPLTGDQSTARVWYLPGQALRVDIVADDPATWEDGQAGLNLQVLDALGNGRQAALTVSVVDETRGEGPGGNEVDSEPWDLTEPLRSLGPGDKIPSELDLAAEAWLASYTCYGRHYRQESFSPPPEPPQTVFADQMRRAISAVAEAAGANAVLQAPEGEQAGFRDWLAISKSDADLRDPWNQPFYAECAGVWDQVMVTLHSSGPDRIRGNSDDFEAGSHRWDYLGSRRDRIEELMIQHLEENLLPLTDIRGVMRTLARQGVDLRTWRDPCGESLHFALGGSGGKQWVLVSTKEPLRDRYDDITHVRRLAVAHAEWDYARPLATRLQDVADQYRGESGQPIPDEIAFRRALREEGIEAERLRDQYGHRLDLETRLNARGMEIALISPGRDGERQAGVFSDDFALWSTPLQDFSASWRPRMVEALKEAHQVSGEIPLRAEVLWRILGSKDLSRSSLRDPWGRRLHARWDLRAFGAFEHGRRGGSTPNRGETALALIRVLSAGNDGKADTVDDIALVRLAARLQLPPEGSIAQIEKRAQSLPGEYLFDRYLLQGTVLDPSGAVVPGAEVVAVGRGGVEASTLTNDEGRYTFRLAAGVYSIKGQLTGFRTTLITDVAVGDAASVDLNIELQLGLPSEILTTSAANAREWTAQGPGNRSTAGQPRSNPPPSQGNLPETLFWSHQLITDDQGRARLEFPLPERTTVWRVSVEASTRTGQAGSCRKVSRASEKAKR